jgi:4,5-DOPA dioxygenase extradiol
MLPNSPSGNLAAAEGRSQSFIEGYSMGSLSMTSYNVGPALDLPAFADGAADLPADVPPDQTNM